LPAAWDLIFVLMMLTTALSMAEKVYEIREWADGAM